MLSRFQFSLLLLCCLAFTMSAAPENTTLIKANNMTTSHSAVDDFWQQGTFSSFSGVNNIRVNYASFISPQHSQCIVLSPGRVEGYLKYKEVAFELFDQGYNLFIIDHRGQGFSQRMLANPYKGYVDKFDDYAEDFHLFMQQVVLPNCTSKPYLLTHSMGGTIGLRYMQLYPQTIQAAVVSSPMIMFNTGAIPFSVAKFLVSSFETVNQWFSKTPWYFFGQGDYQVNEFKNNPLTHDEQRFEQNNNMYQRYPEMQLGGVTAHWMAEAIKAKSDILNNLDKLDAPILVIQSGADTIVDNEAQNLFCDLLHQVNASSCPDGKPVVVKDAFHELFIEQDSMRNQAIAHTLAWFEQH
jgi:lysophospholipase